MVRVRIPIDPQLFQFICVLLCWGVCIITLYPNSLSLAPIPILHQNLLTCLQMSGDRTFRPMRDISAHDLHMEGRYDLMILQERLHLGLSLLGNSP